MISGLKKTRQRGASEHSSVRHGPGGRGHPGIAETNGRREARLRCSDTGIWKALRAKNKRDYERVKFNSRKQEAHETVEAFVMDLYKMAETCKYGELEEELIRDRLVVGLTHRRQAERMTSAELGTYIIDRHLNGA